MQLDGIKSGLQGPPCRSTIICYHLGDVSTAHGFGYRHRLHAGLGEYFRLCRHTRGRKKTGALGLVGGVSHPATVHQLTGNQAATPVHCISDS